MAQLLEIPQVDCHGHLLDLQVGEMLERTQGTTFGMGQIILQVQQVLQTVTRNSSQDLSNKRHLPSRDWSAGASLMAKFNHQKFDILRAVQSMDAELMTTRCKSLIHSDRATQQVEQKLANLTLVKQRLARPGHSLSACRDDLQSLLDYVKAHHNDVQSHWFDHKLGTKYIHRLSKMLGNIDFVSGVCKIQKRHFALMNDDEQKACQRILGPESRIEVKDDFAAFVYRNDRTKSSPPVTTYSARGDSSSLGVADFIGGSAVEMDQVWSNACRYQNNMSKEDMGNLLEPIIMLRYNWRLWDERIVAEAMENIRPINTNDDEEQVGKKRKHR